MGCSQSNVRKIKNRPIKWMKIGKKPSSESEEIKKRCGFFIPIPKETPGGRFISIYKTCSGGVYEGEFNSVTHEYEGFGTYTWENGTKYVGEFKNGKFDGYGIYEETDGYRYEGQWMNGQENGQAKIIYPNEDTFIGEAKFGEFTGFGEYIFHTGKIERGFYEDCKLEGKATTIFPNGDKFEGKYRGGEKHGPGVYFYADGTKEDQNYINGKLLPISNCENLS